MEEDIAREHEIIAAELRLAAVRRKRKKSQATVAKKLRVSQSNVSQFERGGDPRLSTVADYIGALGGKLEVRAVFDDETLPIN
jgi:transcriptional regulator with XRE-family HTH domain